MKNRLGTNYQSFLNVMEEPAPVSIHTNPQKKTKLPFDLTESIPWYKQGYYLQSRPSFTLDPLFHSGAYYVQEASSMLFAQAVKQLIDMTTEVSVLDLCAAPGGKTTLLTSILHPQSIILANEVIKSRVPILKQNIMKWGYPNVHIANHDVQELVSLKNTFDLILVDAPCSGEGLFRKDKAARNEWSAANIEICSARQKRILEGAIPLLKPGGFLLYSTCTYNSKENEENTNWMSAHFNLKSISLEINDSWGVEKQNYLGGLGYQCYPHRVKGEGFFFTCFQKNDTPILKTNNPSKKKKNRKQTVYSFKETSKREYACFHKWIQSPEMFTYFKKPNGVIFAVLKTHLPTILEWDSLLLRKGFGTEIGTIKNNQLVPTHHLGLSTILADHVPSINLNKTNALHFLKKSKFENPIDIKGWAIVKYEGIALGWVKVLPKRINNYLPKEWRIRMDIK